MVLGFLLAVQHGIVWVAVVLVCAQYGVSPVLTWMISRQSGVPLREIGAQYRPALVGGAAMLVAVVLTRLAEAGQPSALQLGSEFVVGVLSYLAATWLLERQTVVECFRFVRLAAGGGDDVGTASSEAQPQG